MHPPRWTSLAAAAILLTACGGSASAPAPARKTSEPKPAATPSAPTDTQQLDALIRARAGALRGGSPRRYAETATGAQAGSDRRAARAYRALPISALDMVVKGTEIDGERATLRVDTVYAFDGIDTEFRKTSRVSALKTEEGWRVSRERPSHGVLAPWEHTTYKARTSRHFTALAPAKLKVGSLMRDLEQGRARMRRGLPGVKPPDRVLVIVARNNRDTKALTKDIRTLGALVAVAESQVAVDGPARRVSALSGERIFILWRSYGDRGEDERHKVVAHELTHAALSRRTSGRTPPWLYEGIAMYAARDNRSGDAGALISGRGILRDASQQGRVEAAMSLARLSNPRALQRMSSLQLSFAYSFSSAAAFAIVERHGQRALLRLLSAFNSEKIRGQPGRRLNERIVRRVLGTSLSELQDQVEAYAAARPSV